MLLPQSLMTEASMLAIQATSLWPWFPLRAGPGQAGLSAASRRLARRWATARLRHRTLERLATLSDHQLRDLGLEGSPHRGAPCATPAISRLACPGRWAPHLLPEARAPRCSPSAAIFPVEPTGAHPGRPSAARPRHQRPHPSGPPGRSQSGPAARRGSLSGAGPLARGFAAMLTGGPRRSASSGRGDAQSAPNGTRSAK